MVGSNSHYQRFQTYRLVPLGLQIKILLGGATNFIGWIFFGIGMIVTIVFVGNTDFSVLYFGENPATTTGTVTHTFSTNASVNDKLVLACEYEYRSPSGDMLTGVSYKTGRVPAIGSEVTIEYLENSPDYSRIQGMSKGMVPLWILFVLIFPIIGISFLSVNILKALKNIQLLKNGSITKGRFIRKEATNVSINKRRVYKLFFEFEAEDGQTYEAIAKSHRYHNLIDEEEETLFYNRDFPQKAVLKDSLPSSALLRPDGTFEEPNLFSVLLSLILPLLSIFTVLLVLVLAYQ